MTVEAGPRRLVRLLTVGAALAAAAPPPAAAGPSVLLLSRVPANPPAHAAPPPAAAGPSVPPAGAQAGAERSGNEIDRFMERVIENRDASWRRAGDFVLREVETLAVEGPAELPIAGFRREYEWYVRGDVVVRSPLRFDGVDIGEAERREYEADWLRRRERREASRREEEAEAAAGPGSGGGAAPAGPDSGGGAAPADAEPLAPEFVADAYYFMEFEFEPGNYYLAGYETLAGREVVKIEYYPTDLFGEGDLSGEDADPDDLERERRLRRGFARTSLVTLWIDPEVHEVVRYTFENVGLDFLPGRWLVRVDGWRASIEMAQPIRGVRLPRRMTLQGQATVAPGTFEVRFTRDYTDYREALTGGRLVGTSDGR